MNAAYARKLRNSSPLYLKAIASVLFLNLFLWACSPDQAERENKLVIYSGRSESLVGPLIDEFEEQTGIDVDVRWGGSAELAATLIEEGKNSPADLFYSQEPGALGAIEDRLNKLPDELLELVPPIYRDHQGRWIGTSGRARVLVYNTTRLSEDDLPQDLRELTDPTWKRRVGWAPTNASFQTMVTAMRKLWGEEATRTWLEEMLANEVFAYEKNTPIVAAVGAGEIDVGLVNHYYLYRFLAEEGESFPARNYYFSNAGPGSLVMVSGIGQLKTAQHPKNAQAFIQFLLSVEAQNYFTSETVEYPTIPGVTPAKGLPSLTELQIPDVDPSDLADLEGTLTLLREVGALP